MTEEPCEECGATFTGPNAHIAIVNHVSAVHIHGTVASEPAEPTTRQQLIEKAFAVADKHQPDGRNHYGYDQCDCGWVAGCGTERWADHLAHLLAIEGLLADPAQTTELEELRLLNRRMQRQVDRLPWRQRDYERARLELRKLNDAMARKNRIIAKRESERDERDERQTRIELLELRAAKATAEIEAWWNSHNGVAHASGALMAVHSLLSGKLDVVLEGDQTRAALAGDQPKAEGVIDGITLPDGSHPRRSIIADSRCRHGRFPLYCPECPGLGKPPLSGEALRDAEEADDAAEPACECFVVPEEQWTRHYDATEPGSQFEQNPDCPVHPAKQADDAAGDLP